MSDLIPIEKPYLLCINIESYCDENGHRYLGELWHKDLRLHLKYLKNLRLACPCRQGNPPPNAIAVHTDPLFEHLQIIDLPTTQGLVDALLKLPLTVAKLWAAVRQAEYVHAGITGWVIPYAWLVAPIAAIYPAKHFLVIVESAPWRLPDNLPASFLAKLKSKLFETLGRACVNSADLTIFTQAEYKNSLLTKHPERGHIIHASWIDKDSIVSEAKAAQLWQIKSFGVQGLKIIFVGRLVASKGILVLLEAMQLLNEANIPVELSILGQGELLSACQQASAALQGATRIRMLETVPYNHEFFSLIQEHHAVVVPSLSDEQPRIVYDAYAQALPVFAANTAGLRDCIRHEDNGILIEPNDAGALADLLQWALQNLHKLEAMGMTARLTACDLTHWEMHKRRWRLLMEAARARGQRVKA
jgi:glycosyltransferase involved in cell wall biosynthesis